MSALALYYSPRGRCRKSGRALNGAWLLPAELREHNVWSAASHTQLRAFLQAKGPDLLVDFLTRGDTHPYAHRVRIRVERLD